MISIAEVLGIIIWSSALSSIAISVAGIIKRKSVWLMIGAMLAVPLSFYISMSPLFKYIGILFPLFQITAGLAIQRNAIWLAWLLLLPFSGITGWLAINVLTQ